MFTLKRIEELPSINHGSVKLAADELGVESFGLQVLDLSPHFTGYPEHDHRHDGQEEVYVVLDGAADLAVGAERVPVESGTIVRVDAAATRKLLPGPQGVRVLAIGCAPGGYERPDAFRVAERA
jgi:mannose-6-phosphate isomerase-like protein (cupin superfamily)